MKRNETRYLSVIFDMDDTLLNTDNLAPYIAVIQSTRRGTDENNAAWKELFKHIPDCTMYEGMQEVFDFIREQGIQVCLCSNSPLKRIERLIKAFDIPIPKDMLIGAYSCGNRMYPLKKPNPAQYFKALEVMNEQPENVVVFGNEDCDITAAHNAKLMSVGCTWGNTREITESLLVAKPERVIDNPKDIIKIIQGV